MTLLRLEDPRWREFVESRPDSAIFHHPAWARLLADCYGYRPMVVALAEGGTVTAGLPAIDVSLPLGGRRWVSLPFTDHCPPLADGAGGDLIGTLRELSRSSYDVLELRAAVADPAVRSGGAFVRHDLALSGDVASAWKRLRRNHRRSVQDAEGAGVRIARGSSASDIDTFYRIHLQTRRRLGVPVQPLRFFRLLHERLIRPGLGFVLTAYQGGVPAAAAVFCAWNGSLTCKYSGRADGFERVDAIHLIYWSAIRWGIENGYHRFDLGRTGVEQTQLRSFKVGWGTREEPLPYSWLGRAPVKESSHRLERAMAPMIRNSSPWVCRAIGEVFYKYAA
jgi:CelD/BcsL family acetyltransferase involved in cellulose biosynthesis